MAQPHDQHRHRLRLRRQADRAALPERELVSVPAARPTPSRSGRSCRPTRHRRSPRSRSNDDLLDLEDVARQADRHDPPARQRDDPRGERHRRARGDEPLRRQSEWLIYLPPTMSPRETTHSGRACSSIPPRRSPTSGERRADGGRARRSTWARAPSSSSAATRRPHASASASLEDEDGVCYTRTGRRFFDDLALERELLATRARRAGAESGSGTIRDGLGLPRLRADALVGEGAGAAAPAVRRGRRGGAGRPAARRSRALAAGGGARRRRRRRCSSDTRCAPDRAERYARAYRRYCWPVTSLRRSPPRPVPPAGDRRRASTSTRTTSGTWTTISSFVDPSGGLLMATPHQRRRPGRSRRARRRQRRGGTS